MKRVAILGGGPAGAFAAERLASAGVNVVLLDEKLAWEKPCGGGLTWKAYSQYPFLIDNDTPKKFIRRTVLAAGRGKEASLTLREPLLVYSRFELNRMMLDRAERAGAQLEKARVLSIARSGVGWQVRTKTGTLEADFCIVATGARNPLREVGTQLGPRDTMSALGYYIPVERDHIDLQFLDNFEGYIWVFPRPGHLSVGIAAKRAPAQTMRKLLDGYLMEKGIPTQGATFYGHLLPSLETQAWQHNRVAGEGWMAVGDAAGLVDPVTGEGIYYALRSADLAARAYLAEAPRSYAGLLQEDFVGDLAYASRLARWLFLGRFLYGTVPARMVQFARRSPRLSGILQDLFAGTQPYMGLKERLLQNSTGALYDMLLSLGSKS